MDGCAPLEEVFSGLMQAFSCNSLVKFSSFSDSLICWMNMSTKRPRFSPLCLNVGGCACSSLSGSPSVALFPRIGHYLSLLSP